MKIANTLQERDAIGAARLSVRNADGTWTVYETGDPLPQWYLDSLQPAEADPPA
jgi:hypothetical protein